MMRVIQPLTLALLLLLAPGARASLLTLDATFLGFFQSGSPYSVLTGTWSATVDTSTLSSPNGSIKARPDSIVFDQAQTFVPDPGNPASNTTWSSNNTYVEVYFANGTPTGVVQVHGDVQQSFAGGFTSSFNDFVLVYSDGSINVGAREPLSYFAYNLQGVGSYAATQQDIPFPVPHTVVNGFVSMTETIEVLGGVMDFFGGAGSTFGGGISIDFGSSSDLVVSVAPAASLNAADIFVFNTFSTNLQAWDIDVSGTLVGTSSIYLPYAMGIDPLLLKVFHFDSTRGLWELLESELDSESGFLVAYTDHFSPLVLAQMGLDDPSGLLTLSRLNAATQQVPEPGMVALLTLGLLGIWLVPRHAKVSPTQSIGKSRMTLSKALRITVLPRSRALAYQQTMTA